MRCLKKAPHGGVFSFSHQSMFLRYYPIQIYPFLRKGFKIPFPVFLYKSIIDSCVSKCGISVEELLAFCFCNDTEDKKDPIFGDSLSNDKLYSVMTSGVLSLKNPNDYSFEELVLATVCGELYFFGLL